MADFSEEKKHQLRGVVVIGGGVAGLTLARNLAKLRIDCVVLESGSESVNRGPLLDSLKNVHSFGLPIKPESRERGLGGTSTTWSGLLGVIDEPTLGNITGGIPGWPISSDDLYSSMDDWREDHNFPSRSAFSAGIQAQPHLTLGRYGLDEEILWIQPTPTRYGPRTSSGWAQGAEILTDRTVCSIRRVSDRGWIVDTVSSDGRQALFATRNVVLAAGAIESIRLLQVAQQKGQILTELPSLGRFFMNHPKGIVGHAKLSGVLEPRLQTRGVGLGFHAVRQFKLSADELRSKNLPSPSCQIIPSRLSRVLQGINRRISSKTSSHALPLGELVSAPRGLLGGKFANRLPQFQSGALLVHSDIAPRWENRVTLSSSMDPFGLPIPEIHLKHSDADLKAIRLLLQALSKWLEGEKLGKVDLFSDEVENLVTTDASHHLGGARMGLDSGNAVVDKDLKVFGESGLYVLGGAVFPTGGHINPTLTIVALAERLAQHLAVQVK